MQYMRKVPRVGSAIQRDFQGLELFGDDALDV